MENKECEIVRDLLPQYIEKELSRSSEEMVEAHLAECEECRSLYESMNYPLNLSAGEEEENREAADPLKKMRKKSYLSSFFSVVIMAAIIAISIILMYNLYYGSWDFIINPKYERTAQAALDTMVQDGTEAFSKLLEPVIPFEQDSLGDYNLRRVVAGQRMGPLREIEIGGEIYCVSNYVYASLQQTEDKALSKVGELAKAYQRGDWDEFFWYLCSEDSSYSEDYIIPEEAALSLEKKFGHFLETTIEMEIDGKKFYRQNGEYSPRHDMVFTVPLEDGNEVELCISADYDAMQTVQVMPKDVYLEFVRQENEWKMLMQQNLQYYERMGYEGYRDKYRKAVIAKIEDYAAQYGALQSARVDNSWHLFGNREYYINVSLIFASGAEYHFSFIMEKGATNMYVVNMQ